MFEEAREAHAADLAYDHDLTLRQGRQLSDLAVHSLDPSHAPDSPAHLADPAVAEAFVSAPLGLAADDASVAHLERFARRAVDRGLDTAGAWYALACVAEHRGALAAQRAHLERSLRRDPEFPPSLAALGFLAFVEGDARCAERLLRRSGEADDSWMLHSLSHYPTPAATAGRNQRCPCGSGWKYKHCCAGAAVHPLHDRAFWLWDKADAWVMRLAQQGPLWNVVEELTGVAADHEPDDGALHAVREVPMRAVALLDGGLLVRFLDRCGGVLPEDERALAATWTNERHRVWRVVATEPGRWLRLSEVGGDRTVEVSDGAVSRCTQPGEVVYGAVLLTGGGWLLPSHPACLDPGDGEALAELVAAGIDPLAVAATVVRGIRSATM